MTRWTAALILAAVATSGNAQAQSGTQAESGAPAGIGTVDLTDESGLTACLYSVDIGFGESLYIRENPVTVRYASAPGYRSDFRFGLAWHPGVQTRIENDVRELLRKALAAYMDANFSR